MAHLSTVSLPKHAVLGYAAPCRSRKHVAPTNAAAITIKVAKQRSAVRLSRFGFAPSKPSIVRRAAADEGPAVALLAPVQEAEVTSLADIKAALLDSIFGTERGLSASSEVRAEINELICQLEARNPTPSPAEATDKLTGNWKLVYTSNSELLAVLALSKLPFVGVGDITQSVDAVAMSVENKVQLSVPLTRTAFSTTASFEVRSPKRLQIKVEKGTVQTPQLLTEIDIPSTLTVMGQVVDLSQVKSVLEPVNAQLKNLLQTVGNVISQTPDVQFPIQSDRAQTWLLTTYLDDDTRITRGDGGSVFILVKEVSFTQ